MDRVVSIATHESNSGITVNILGNGKILGHTTHTLASPPRIVVDIACAAQNLETAHIAQKNSLLSGIRVGYHPPQIRVVLDVKGDLTSEFVTRSGERDLSVFIAFEKKAEQEKGQLRNNDPVVTGNPANAETKTEIAPNQDVRSQSEISGPGQIVIGKVPPVSPIPLEDVPEVAQASMQNDFQDAERPQASDLEMLIPERRLTQTPLEDGRDDTVAFNQALKAYRNQDWSGVVETLTRLIKTYPASGHLERAYFLLAKSYDQFHSGEKAAHFKEIKRKYEDAINRFQSSEYVSDAWISIGNLCFEAESYFEALGYLNLVLNNDTVSINAARALIQKSRILLQLRKREEALEASAVLEKVVSRFQELPENIEAKTLRAKILYEFNRFDDSLDILAKLKTSRPASIYQYPEIYLYLGYNYYQLGDNANARESLLKFYNSCPEQETSHLILSQIGDTYRNQGFGKQALKYYQMVIERYPDSEGAVISKIRLAEHQEEGGLKSTEHAVTPVNVIGEEIALAKDIYEGIINDPLNKSKRSTLTQLALLKLSILYQKEKEYYKSFMYLKTMYEEYPLASFKSDWEKALHHAIEGIFEKEASKGNYTNVINFYMNEKEFFSILNDPRLFLTVAQAFIKLDFEDMGIEMFKKAEPLFADEEKPAELLLLLARDLFKKERFDDALPRLDLLIEKHPQQAYLVDALRLKGSILLKQKKFSPASEMFSAALTQPVSGCERLKILIDKAQALTACKSKDKAFETTAAADDFKKNCPAIDDRLLQEIGDLYFDLSHFQEAVKSYKLAFETAKEKSDKISALLKIARCYTLLNQKEDFLALYDQISSLNDPFWSNLAKERMEDFRFQWEMQQKNREWKKGEKT